MILKWWQSLPSWAAIIIGLFAVSAVAALPLWGVLTLVAWLW
jgi:hypothetical protein